VDDEPFILKLHAHMLRELGFRALRSHASGASALADLDREHAHLVLLDLSMPDMDGIQIIQQLAERSFRGGLVLISGEDRRLLQTAARLVQDHGLAVVGHLKKPVTPTGLSTLIEAWERWSGGTKRAAGKVYTPEEVVRAIQSGELVNHYQPKVSVATGEVLGVECLTRWQHGEDGLVSPALFIGIAERSGAIEELTQVSMTRALAEIKQLQLSGHPLQVSINVAASTLASLSFVDFVADATRNAGVRNQDVILEVTESQLISDRRTPFEVLTRLHLMRFGLSIDDFGTGYSSLSQLRDIPFHELKIDQSFVHRAPSDATARAIFDASLGLARDLGMRTVAEGVEDRADWDMVCGTECHEAQGYFIARPMAAADLPGWIQEWNGRRSGELGFA